MSDVNKQLLDALGKISRMTMSMYASAGEAMSDAKRIANEAIAAAEQAQQAEPVAWEVRNGVVTHDFYKTAEDAEEVARDMQKSHDLSGSIAAFNVRPVYAQPPAVADRDAIRRIFMAHGFTIKEGQTDLKPYVYEAAESLLRELSPAVAVPDGYALVPIEPTPEMVAAGAEGDSQFYDHAQFVYCAMIAAASKP